VTVITTIRGFGDLFWTEVVTQIDAMNDTVLAFQAQAKKLPKAWAAAATLPS
jgi:dynein heavy chain